MLSNIKTIFFDYDGTIHNSIEIYTPAFNKAYQYLADNGLVKERTWKKEELIKWLGYNSKDMWMAFMPELEEQLREQASKIVGQEMMENINKGKAVLYEDALDTLDYLKKKGYTLVFISNCNTYYKDSHKAAFDLGRYFKDMIGSQEFDYISKADILEKIMNRYPKDYCIVGDRSYDIEAGTKNKIHTIGCLYGFGSKEELKDADIFIGSISELKKYF